MRNWFLRVSESSLSLPLLCRFGLSGISSTKVVGMGLRELGSRRKLVVSPADAAEVVVTRVVVGGVVLMVVGP